MNLNPEGKQTPNKGSLRDSRRRRMCGLCRDTATHFAIRKGGPQGIHLCERHNKAVEGTDNWESRTV
jgi:hypothetical protein